MKFIPEGPLIPEELLEARDEGRVVFFCGSGVSMAYAKLPDFFGLAGKVLNELHLAEDSAASKVLEEARCVGPRTGEYGLISADKVFTILERDFPIEEVQRAVARSIAPEPKADLAAHKTLLKLATTSKDKVQLVTTNFDRLFEICGKNVRVLEPPRLPILTRDEQLSGIVYLHGRVRPDYQGAESQFVLSGSEFGRAYLSEGWATSFVKEILERYVVVFVGYSAEDPPVQYLLEGLHKSAQRLDGVFAFQHGDRDSAMARWSRKGVVPIPYGDSHDALWETLEAWAEMAENPARWYNGLILKAQDGPTRLTPFERGQMAHIVSSSDGAKRFANAEPPPPAEWLCVFDSTRRFAAPRQDFDGPDRTSKIDPFDRFGLDYDERPVPESDDSPRKTPDSSFDVFTILEMDRKSLSSTSSSGLDRRWHEITDLPPRLYSLAQWIIKSCSQSACVWWAAHQDRVHPSIQLGIAKSCASADMSPIVYKAWQYLLRAWRDRERDLVRNWYYFQNEARTHGWDEYAVIRYSEITEPRISVSPNPYRGNVPPAEESVLKISDLLRVEVAYPDDLADLDIPGDRLSLAVAVHRRHAESAERWEAELRDISSRYVPPLATEARSKHHVYGEESELPTFLLRFVDMMLRLVSEAPLLAQREYESWPRSESHIFLRLRLAVCGHEELARTEEVFGIIKDMSAENFWAQDCQADLMVLLRARWGSFESTDRSKIEDTLLEGPAQIEAESDEDYVERRAWKVLTRIVWLAEAGCEFNFDYQSVKTDLVEVVPLWKDEHAGQAMESATGSGGSVEIDTEHKVLLGLSADKVIETAHELSGRVEFLLEKQPFAGLSASEPKQAFAALQAEASRGNFPFDEWQTFLYDQKRNSDSSDLMASIADSLVQYPKAKIVELLGPISEWCLSISKQLSQESPKAFNRLLGYILDLVSLDPEVASQEILQDVRVPDWPMRALNAPVGKLVRALFNLPEFEAGVSGLSPEWKSQTEAILHMGGDVRRITMTLLAYSLEFLYQRSPEWVRANILGATDSLVDEDLAAFWQGLLWGGGFQSDDLIGAQKSHLLKLPVGTSFIYGDFLRSLAHTLLVGWWRRRIVSNDEMRRALLESNEAFRLHVLRGLKEIARKSASLSNLDEHLAEFFTSVWPRQSSIRRSKTSAELCNLAFTILASHSEVVDAIQPLVSTVDGDRLFLSKLLREKDSPLLKEPERALALLFAALGDNPRVWPFETREVLDQIAAVDETVRSDERLLKLLRKWDAR